MPRVMRPIEPGALSAAAACHDARGSPQTGSACRTATAYSTSSSRTPGASSPASSDASLSSLPSPSHSQSTGPNDRWQSRSPNRGYQPDSCRNARQGAVKLRPSGLLLKGDCQGKRPKTWSGRRWDTSGPVAGRICQAKTLVCISHDERRNRTSSLPLKCKI